MSIQTALHSGINGRMTDSDGLAVIGDNLECAANLVQVSIQNLNGLTVRTVTVGKNTSGERALTWGEKDGIEADLPAGIYSFSVNEVNAEASSYTDATIIKAVMNRENRARRK